MSSFDLGLLPSGHLYGFPSIAESPTDRNKHLTAIDKAFTRSVGDGLFSLAALKNGNKLSPSLKFWRNFSCQYLSERCLLAQKDPLQPDLLKPLTTAEVLPMLMSAPPMCGAEYLSATVLQETRSLLDNWVCKEIQASGGLGVLLARRAPQWHQVGRVCFHLAENKNDSDFPFAFMATYASELSEQGQVRHQHLSRALQEYAGTKNKKSLIRLLSPVQLATESSSLIKELVDSGDIYHPLAWSPKEAYEFLKDAPKYEQCGIVVRLPDWWKKRNRPRAKITIGENRKKFNTDSLLDFKLQIALGDESLSKADLKKLIAENDGLVFIRGQWIEVDQKKLGEALAHWKKIELETIDGGLTFAEGMRLLAGAPVDLREETLAESQEWSLIQPGKWLATLLDELRSPAQAKAANPGKALKANLRPYQQEGVNWLWLLSQLGLGACLADDMGLGKTMQVISILLIMKKQQDSRPSLLVLPASLIGNWKSELERFAPSLRSLFYHSSQLSKKSMDVIANKSLPLDNIDIVVTTYGTLMRQDWLQVQAWKLLVLDEAHAIKNPGARQSKAVKTLNAKSRIALTGTPVENRLSDLWSLFDFLNPGLLGSASRFNKFIKSLAERQSDQYLPLRNLVSPYILRRLKTDRSIISDLPQKTEVSAYCGLSKVQAALYQQTVEQMAKTIESLEGIKRRGLVLSYLLRFKQLCNHPSQLLGDDKYDPKNSGKFLRLAELCEEIVSRQEKLLVFTQFREIITPLENFLAKQFSQPGLVLHGGTAVKKRQKLVERFQDEKGPPFFILSLKAGGTGLNLTQASHVIHFDRWWNPAVENQATDRAFRLGQKNNVLVHKFICQGTIEEKIDTLINEKIALSNELLDGGADTLLTEMDNETLLNLVSLDINRTQV